ncbi:hypothetical protein H4R35_004172 [Dimargaris xerosporica]|nr:hypothetical protein H4R35_004172 [Dimargaris xerosporica]
MQLALLSGTIVTLTTIANQSVLASPAPLNLYQDEDAQFIDELINEVNKYGVLHLATALVNYGELLVTSGLIDEEYLAVVARFNTLKSEFNTDNYADQLRILFERVKVLALDPGTADARIRGYFNTIHDKPAALMAQQ